MARRKPRQKKATQVASSPSASATAVVETGVPARGSRRRASDELLVQALRHTDGMVLVSTADEEQTVSYVNDAFCRNLGYSVEEIRGRSLRTLAHERTEAAVWQRLTRVFEAGVAFAEEVVVRHASGEGVALYWHASGVRDVDGKPSHLISFQTLSIARAHAADELTGMRNADGFRKRAEERLKRARVQQRKLVVFDIDIDSLDDLRAEYSDQAARDALQAAAVILQEAFRSDDVIGRICDSKFVVMAQVRNESECEAMGLRLQQKVAEHNEHGVYEFELGVSLGYQLADPADDLAIVMASAERHMLRQRSQKFATEVAV